MKKAYKQMAIVLAVAMVLALLPVMAMAGSAEQVVRLSGDDRWETSVAVAKAAYPEGTDKIIIARGDNAGGWADGLAASFLAGVLDAPILLTAPGSLPAAVATAIEDDLNPSKAYVLGGTVAISADVEKALKDLGLDTERIAGGNRVETAVKIAKKGGNSFDTAFVVQGRAPADSMIAGAKAFAEGIPILLVSRDLPIPTATADALADLGVQNIIIVGGSGVVSGEVEAALAALSGVNNVKRLAGANRVATSVTFAEDQFSSNPAEFSIVNGFRGLADAVGAAVFGAPILYVNSIPEAVGSYLDDAVTGTSLFRIFGGTAVVGGDVADDLQTIISAAPYLAPYVESVETVNEGKQASARIGEVGNGVVVETTNRGLFGNDWVIGVVVPGGENQDLTVEINGTDKKITVSLAKNEDGNTNDQRNHVSHIAKAINDKDHHVGFTANSEGQGSILVVDSDEFSGGENIKLLVTWSEAVEVDEFASIELAGKGASGLDPTNFALQHTLSWDDIAPIDDQTELFFNEKVAYYLDNDLNSIQNKEETWRYEAMTGEWQPYLGN